MANILVVDDEIGIRALLAEILSDEGHVVRTAESAQQAREARIAETPDLVLLDIWMQDTDGVTLLKEWQRDGYLTMPVIMMSGHATIDTAVEATRIGALNFLEKPIEMKKLLQAVEQGLARGQDKNLMATIQQQPQSFTTSATETNNIATNYVNKVNSPQVSMHIPSAESSLISEAALTFDMPLREARDRFEKLYFEHHLAQEGGSMTRVAEKTGLERTHLYRKLKQLGVEPVKASKKHS